MTDTKYWWQSRVIISSLVGLLFIVAARLHILPQGLTQADVVEAVLAFTSFLAIVFRLKSTAEIVKK